MQTYEVPSLDVQSEEDETLSIPIATCFTPTEAKRWDNIKNELKSINKKNKISNYARPCLLNLMDRLEFLIGEHKEKSQCK
jgi:hypothetical protein